MNFAIYGDSTDVDNWVEVWIDGTKYLSTDTTHGWALSSVTGPLATTARPITNAVLTFNAVQTGTLQILGAQRPRRLVQFNEGAGVSARDLNRVITGLTAMEREFWDFKLRAFVAPVGGTGSIVTGLTSGILGPVSSTNGQVAVFSGTSGAAITGGPVLTDGQVFVGQTGAPFQGKTLTGDVTVNAAGVTTIGANKVTTGKLATQAASSFLGNPTNATGQPVAFSPLDLPFSASINASQDVVVIRSNSDSALHYTTPLIFVRDAGGGGGTICVVPAATSFICGTSTSGIQADATDNTAYGYNSLTSVVHSSRNTAIGSQALQSHTSDLSTHGLVATGGHNVAVGYRALLNDANADENVAVGAEALVTLVGHSPGWDPAGLVMNGTCVSGTPNVTVASTTGITAGQIVQAPGCFPNDNRGTNSVLSVTDGTHFVMSENANASTTVSMNFNIDLTGGKNVAVGRQVLQGNIYGHYNTCAGLTTCQWITIGRENTGIGATALDACTSCQLNTAVGANVLGGYYNPPTNGSPFGTPITGNANTAVGYNTMIFATTASTNVAVGYRTILSCATCANNIFIGADNHPGNWNPVSSTGTAQSFTYNVVIGTTVSGLTTGSKNTVIGSNLSLSAALANNVILADGDGNIRLKFNNSSTLNLPGYAASTILYTDGSNNVTSASITGLIIGAGAGGPGVYAGTTCASTFVRSLNASGVATCQAVVLTADVSGILPSANGGTASQFFTVSGPATSAKTFTFPNANATVLTDNAAVTVAQGGTGRATLTNHGVLVGAGTAAITQLAVGASGTLLQGSAAADPAFTATPTLGVASSVTGQLLLANSGNTGVVTVQAPSSATSWTWTYPTSGGSSGQLLSTNGSGTTSWITASGTGTVTNCSGVTSATTCIESFDIFNCTLAVSNNGTVLTVAVKDNAGSDPTSTSPCRIPFRSTTANVGSTTYVSVTAALSITTNAAGATLGSLNSKAFRFWVVAFNNAGTVVLALYNASKFSDTGAAQCYPIDETQVQSSTAMSGSATANGTYYTPNGTTLTSKAIKIVGYVEYDSTGLPTAGTYNSDPDFVQTFGRGVKKPCETVQVVPASTTTRGTAGTSTSYTATGVTLSGSITPTSAANGVRVTTTGMVGAGQGGANAGNGVWVRVIRGTTGDVQIGSSQGVTAFINAGNTSNQFIVPASIIGLDYPNTASSQQYTPQIKTNNVATDVVFPYGDNASPSGKAVGYMLMEEIMG